MTGFARHERAADSLKVLTEARSYNSRHSDPILRLSAGYDFLEEVLRPLAATRFTRGRLEIRISIRDTSQSDGRFEVDWPLAEAYHDALVQLRRRFSLRAGIRPETLAEKNGVVRIIVPDRDTEACRREAVACVSKALDELESMRLKEGKFLSVDLDKRLERIAAGVDRVESTARDLPMLYRERLSERIRILIGRQVELDPDRIVHEAALMADRSDISEEIVRTRSHIAQFRELMGAPEPAGRKLNFLVQELNRELNTMGSKTQLAGLSQTIVDARAELEKIREQVQNVE